MLFNGWIGLVGEVVAGLPPVEEGVGDDAVVDADGAEVLLGAVDLAGFTGELEAGELFGAFGLTDQFEENFAVFVTGDAPVGVVVADDTGEFDLEGGRELEIEEDLLVIVSIQTIYNETMLDF